MRMKRKLRIYTIWSQFLCRSYAWQTETTKVKKKKRTKSHYNNEMRREREKNAVLLEWREKKVKFSFHSWRLSSFNNIHFSILFRSSKSVEKKRHFKNDCYCKMWFDNRGGSAGIYTSLTFRSIFCFCLSLCFRFAADIFLNNSFAFYSFFSVYFLCSTYLFECCLEIESWQRQKENWTITTKPGYNTYQSRSYKML